MGGMFSKPKMPKEQPPVRMPIEGDKTSSEAAARRRAELAASKGRDSTDLTDALGS